MCKDRTKKLSVLPWIPTHFGVRYVLLDSTIPFCISRTSHILHCHRHRDAINHLTDQKTHTTAPALLCLQLHCCTPGHTWEAAGHMNICFKIICASGNLTRRSFRGWSINLWHPWLWVSHYPSFFNTNNLISTRQKHPLDLLQLYYKLIFFADFSSQFYTIFTYVRKEKKLWTSGRYQKEKHVKAFKSI